MGIAVKTCTDSKCTPEFECEACVVSALQASGRWPMESQRTIWEGHPERVVMRARWRKHGGEWLLFCEHAQTGDRVVVRRSTGEERPVLLGQRVGANLFREAPRETTRNGVAVEVGAIYETSDGRHVMVEASRTTGNLYGKVYDFDHGVWRYEASVLGSITRRVSSWER